MEIVILPDTDAVARVTADIIQQHLGAAGTAGTAGSAGSAAPVLGLATGSTPLGTYAELARRHRDEGLSFATARAFLLDEYVGLPAAHPESYSSVIRREFVDLVDLDPARVSGPDGEAADLAAEGSRYDAAIRAAGGVDVQLLGIGTDGHIGFNEPGSSLASRTRVKTLTERTRLDNARFFQTVDEVPHHVLTQGLGTIREAEHLLLLGLGAGKAPAIRAAVEGPVTAMCPASVLQLHAHVTVLVDEAAAAELEHTEYYRYALANKPSWQPF